MDNRIGVDNPPNRVERDAKIDDVSTRVQELGGNLAAKCVPAWSELGSRMLRNVTERCVENNEPVYRGNVDADAQRWANGLQIELERDVDGFRGEIRGLRLVMLVRDANFDDAALLVTEWLLEPTTAPLLVGVERREV